MKVFRALPHIVAFIFTIALVLPGCREEGPPRIETYPVVGKITVDGKEPGSAIQVGCYPVEGMNAEFPTFSQAESQPDGSFEISTYETGDGLPSGDYVLTFAWQEFNLMSRNYSGPDRLKRRYNDPKNAAEAFQKITVKPGEQLDLGTIALTTK